MTWEIRNVGWPITIQAWNNTFQTKHYIQPTPIMEPYKIVVPTYGNNYFYTENYKGRNINFYE